MVKIDNNNVTSVGVLRKVAWVGLETLNIRTRMSDVGENYFKDGKRLTEGCFPYMQYLSIHNPWAADKNEFHESFFVCKMEIPSLRYLGTICLWHRHSQEEVLLWPVHQGNLPEEVAKFCQIVIFITLSLISIV